MPLTLFKGNAPCPACEKVIAQLKAADIEFTLDEDNAHLFFVGTAVGGRAKPILVWYAIGAGLDTQELIEGWIGE